MYTTSQLSEDLKVLENLEKGMVVNFDAVKEEVKNKTLKRDFMGCLFSIQSSLNEFKALSKNIKVQDIYATMNEDIYATELLDRLKKVNASEFSIRESFNDFMNVSSKYLDIYDLVFETLNSLNFFIEIDESTFDKYFEITSNFFLIKNIIPFEIDEDFSFVDDVIDVMYRTKNESLIKYIEDVFAKMDELEKEAPVEQQETKVYVESGFEDFSKNYEENQEEDLTSILRKKNILGGGM